MARIVYSATITAGTALSDAIDLSVGTASLIFLPPTWTPALLSFQVSPDNISFADLVDLDMREISINVTPATAIHANWIPVGVGWLKFRSGSRGNPIIQTANRVFTIAINT